jgi:hypothetical protein
MNDAILVAYGRAMQSAQRLESRLKILFMLHNLVSGVSKSLTPITDDDFEILIVAGDKKTLGRALHGVLQKLAELPVAPFPENAQKGLCETVQARNFLGHHYFAKRGLVAEDESSWRYVVAELGWFSELFDAWVPSLDKWADMLLTTVGISAVDLKSGQQAVDELAPDVRREQFTALKESLERIGIHVPPVPTSAAQPGVAG